MSLYITWDGGSWYFDATLNEQHESKLVVTEHPVETGPNIADSARRELDRFSCEVFVSNSPLVDLNGYGGTEQKINLDDPTLRYGQPGSYKAPFAPTPGAVFNAIGDAVASVGAAITGKSAPVYAASVIAWDAPFDAVVDSLGLMRWLQDYAKPVTVYSSSWTYENVLLEVTQLHLDPSDGDGGRYRLTFKAVRQVTLAFTDAPQPTDPRGKPPAAKGAKGTKDTPPARKKSAAAKLDDDTVQITTP